MMLMASIGNGNDDDDDNEVEGEQQQQQQPPQQKMQSRPAPRTVHRQQPTLRAVADEREHPRVVRPHRTPQASTSRPIDIAQVETDRLVRDGVPIRNQSHLSKEDIEQISTTLLQYPRTMPNVIPIPIGQRDRNGEQLYLLSKRPVGHLGGYMLTMARLAPNGSGTVYHVDADQQWDVTPYYLSYEEICYLQAAASDARGVGHRPEGA